jgi:hypothetical protein
VKWNSPILRGISELSNVKIVMGLPYRKGCVWTEEELGEEEIVGLVFGFELVATDGAVGASQVAWFPGSVKGAEGCGNVLGEFGGRWWC